MAFRNILHFSSINAINQIGFYVFLVSGIFLTIFSYSFSNSVIQTINYVEDICHIETIEILDVEIYCKNSKGYINILKIPCVLAVASLKNTSNIKFYRSFEEKSRVQENDVNCSFLPLHCQDDPVYTKRVLVKNYKKHFPSELSTFLCYTLTVDDKIIDALQYIPYKRVYYMMLLVLVFGVVLSIGLFIFVIKTENTGQHFFNRSLYEKLMNEIVSTDFLGNSQYDNISRNYQHLSQENIKEVSYLSKLSTSKRTETTEDDDVVHFRLRYRTGRISGFKKSHIKSGSLSHHSFIEPTCSSTNSQLDN